MQEEEQLAQLRDKQAKAQQTAAAVQAEAGDAKKTSERQMSELQQQIAHLQAQHASLLAAVEVKQASAAAQVCHSVMLMADVVIRTHVGHAGGYFGIHCGQRRLLYWTCLNLPFLGMFHLSSTKLPASSLDRHLTKVFAMLQALLKSPSSVCRYTLTVPPRQTSQRFPCKDRRSKVRSGERNPCGSLLGPLAGGWS